MVYHQFAHFELSTNSCVPASRLSLLRLVLGFFITLSLVVQIVFNTTDPSLPQPSLAVRLLCDLEIYALVFGVLAFILAERAARINTDGVLDKTSDLKKKKNALIVNEIAISLNLAVFMIYFVFLPIVYGARAFEKNVNASIYNAIGYSVALFAVLFHFASCKFALLD